LTTFEDLQVRLSKHFVEKVLFVKLFVNSPLPFIKFLQVLQFLELHLSIVNWPVKLLHLKMSSSLTEQGLRRLKLSNYAYVYTT